MRQLAFWILFFIVANSLHAQENDLEYFIAKAEENVPILLENENLQKIGALQNDMIHAQNNAFQVGASSDILIAPYFNNNGKLLDITTMPSANAIGYDVGITNGGLYSAQVNVTRNLFNKAIVDNLLFQNKMGIEALQLTSEDIKNQLGKNVTDTYILAYQIQLQENFTKNIIEDFEKRLSVVELLVKRGILLESDYLLLQVDLENRRLELDQLHNNFNNAYTQLGNLSGVEVIEFPVLPEPKIALETQMDSFFYERRFINDSLQLTANQEVFENQYKPQVQVYGNSGLNAVELANIERKAGLSAGLRLTIPIYDGKQRKINAMQNRLMYENLEAYKRNTEIQLQNNLESIRDQITTAEKNLADMEIQLGKQENILEIFKGKLVQGQVSIIDYLNIIQNYRLMAYTKMQAQTNLWLLYSQFNFTNW
ncbi:outer membrane efflux protein [Arenibacter sp. NBRC 103722]|uniref:TolC family protein n=1 Tax=Arenibacter sp. NBRC 103722 TaxID=1113929 RepID=UPI000852D912|nr:TolC family protein [Arenibacter sp. NBRC 103722]MDX1766442.1 TolC family protein [Arenibacter troitsensis]GBF21599.1 outer membrane efflux protein [Arenibacter sp. NBRC 103722]